MSAILFEDYLELQNLIAKYFLTTDNGDVDGFLNCWVEAEQFSGYDLGALGLLSTWQELSDFITQKYVTEGGLASGKRHTASNIKIVAVSATEALISHDMIVFEVADMPNVFITGRYDDGVAVKTDKGWKFKSRKVTLDGGSLKKLS
jgi:hypothetical protein